jgi:hypothetical protein
MGEGEGGDIRIWSELGPGSDIRSEVSSGNSLLWRPRFRVVFLRPRSFVRHFRERFEGDDGIRRASAPVIGGESLSKDSIVKETGEAGGEFRKIGREGEPGESPAILQQVEVT